MSSSNSNPLDFLIEQGRLLSDQLKNIKDKDKAKVAEIIANTSVEVKKIVSNILDTIKSSPPEAASITKESILKLVEKLKAILEDFVKHDSDHKSVYEEVTDLLANFKFQKQGLGSDTVTVALPDDPADSADAELSADTDPNEPDYGSGIGKLSEDEKIYLCCFLLFPAEVEIKKREIIHCWEGMSLVNLQKEPIPVDGERRLAKFVAMGLIQRTFQNKKLLNRYKMTKRVHDSISYRQAIPTPQKNHDPNPSVTESQNNPPEPSKTMTTVVKEGSFATLHHRVIAGGNNKSTFRRAISIDNPLTSSENDDVLALLNLHQNTLNAGRFKNLSGMDKLKVVHLGSWRQDPKKYIVVEDVDAFKHLKSLSKVSFLSLEGVSGMVKLPVYVYDLALLKVLDLRDCNNLENLPGGIESLKSLTHLDLSGCYLLDHIPLEIKSLINLRVLKGFVVNTEEQADQAVPVMNERQGRNPTGNGIEGQNKKKKKKLKGGRAASNPCPFNELSALINLRKLSIITRKMDFPTRNDFETFCKLKELSCLRITWVGKTELPASQDEVAETFPPTLTKLELQAATQETASRILRLISYDSGNCGLEKLYLRGGGLRELKYPFPQPTVVRLRYLPDLQIDWDDFTKLFPNLDRLEVTMCPNLILFPCDENGVWENTQSFLVIDDSNEKYDDDEKNEIHNEIESS